MFFLFITYCLQDEFCVFSSYAGKKWSNTNDVILFIFHNLPAVSVTKCHLPSCGGGDSVSSPSYSDSEIDVVHAAFSVTTATHYSGGRKGGYQHVSFPVGVKGINQSTLIK